MGRSIARKSYAQQSRYRKEISADSEIRDIAKPALSIQSDTRRLKIVLFAFIQTKK
jgi:hypothetical protein